MVFDEAMEALRAGKLVAREGWGGAALELVTPNGCLLPHVSLRVDAQRVRWLFSEESRAARDWVEVPR